jgi:phosphatidate phosphatase APP1
MLLALQLPLAAAVASPLKSDEEVVLFPTAAHLAEDGTLWVVPIHGWVFEPERDSLLRNGMLAAAAAALDLGQSAVESAIFRERAAWFLVDNERGKRIDLTVAQDARKLGPSEANGHLLAEIKLERRGSGAERAPFWLQYAVQPPEGDERIFSGQALFVPDEGLSVISDIDDTVKVSQVGDKKALLENTFLKPFVPAPGMAALYQDLLGKGAAFHYVSSSPWQLYPPLRDFFDRVGLPNGSFHLRSFRFKDENFFNLFKSSRETKPPVIETLLATFPDRDFVLIGDSGEADPEIYGDIARRHPDQVRAILIRNVTAESADDSRYVDGAFKALPPDLWLLFDEADAAGAFLAGRV